MIILGVETATERVSVAIGSHRGVLGCFEVAGGRRHAEVLTPAIEAVCRYGDVALDEVAVVAVDVGPGLFTGMRVGLAAAKAIAQALRVPMIGVSSLDLVAFPLRHCDRTIVAMIDARKGEVFSAFYRAAPGGVQRVTEPTVGSVSDVVGEIVARGQETICVGDGALRYAAEIVAEATKVEIGDQWQAAPSAATLVQLAHPRALREEWVNPWELQPMYLRLPDAQINWTTRGGAP